MSRAERLAVQGSDAAACDLTSRGTPLGATTGRSQASAPEPCAPEVCALKAEGTASGRSGEARSQGCSAPAQPAGSAGGQVGASDSERALSLGKITGFAATRPATSWKSFRAVMYRLRDAMRRLTDNQRMRGCGYRLIQLRVAVSAIASDKGLRAHYDGILAVVWFGFVRCARLRSVLNARQRFAPPSKLMG